ncbi:MAG: SPOR domain-containing protein [Betaproteobacteria bacterium]|nr:SPOR domain-containing protein [Betaproteobacteria bacterium]
MSADRESRSHQRDEQASDPMADHKRRARWRLLGAVIIVAAVAGLAPLLLEDQARPLSQDLLVEIPSRNSVFSKIESLRPASPPSAAAVEETLKPPEPKTEPKPEPKTEPKAEAKSESKPEARPEQKAKAEPKAEPKKSAAAAGFLVQVGAYSKLEAANTVKARLASGGHRVSVETIKLDDGSERHRVRIGPFETRELANQVRDRAKSQGYDAIVVAP